MPNTWRGRKPLFLYDHELERTLCNMNRNMGIIDDDPNKNIPAPLMFMVSCYPMLRVNTNRGDKIPLHDPKNTTEAMTI